MSLSRVVDNKLKQSSYSLKQVSEIASYLLEDVRIRIERTGIEPLHETEFNLLSASTTVNQATSTQITDSDIFLNTTTSRLKERIHNVVGHSPDIVSDIVNNVVKPIKKLIDTALSPVQDAVKGVIDTVHSSIDNSVLFIQNGFDNATKTISSWIDNGFNLIGEGVTFIQSSINSLLAGVADVFDFGILILQQSFKGLTDGLTSLLSFEIEDVLKLNESMSKQFIEKQSEDLKKRAGVD